MATEAKREWMSEALKYMWDKLLGVVSGNLLEDDVLAVMLKIEETILYNGYSVKYGRARDKAPHQIIKIYETPKGSKQFAVFTMLLGGESSKKIIDDNNQERLMLGEIWDDSRGKKRKIGPGKKGHRREENDKNASNDKPPSV